MTNASMTDDTFIFPTSYAQQRLWFLDQLEPGSAVYILSRAWRVAGTPRYEALQQAVAALVERHESLRTTFTMVDGRPMQLVAARQQAEVSRIDPRGLALPEREAALQLATEAALGPFDLARGPLFRVAVIDL